MEGYLTRRVKKTPLRVAMIADVQPYVAQDRYGVQNYCFVYDCNLGESLANQWDGYYLPSRDGSLSGSFHKYQPGVDGRGAVAVNVSSKNSDVPVYGFGSSGTSSWVDFLWTSEAEIIKCAKDAFKSASGLTSVSLIGVHNGFPKIPSTCTSLIYGANMDFTEQTDISESLRGCSSLTEIHFPRQPSLVKVTDTSLCFSKCSGITELDLSWIDWSNIEDCSLMFLGCSALTTIYVAPETDLSVLQHLMSVMMFQGCESLVGGAGTVFDPDHVDAEYARIDDPQNGKPGYFTAKDPHIAPLEVRRLFSFVTSEDTLHPCNLVSNGANLELHILASGMLTFNHDMDVDIFAVGGGGGGAWGGGGGGYTSTILSRRFQAGDTVDVTVGAGGKGKSNTVKGEATPGGDSFILFNGETVIHASGGNGGRTGTGGISRAGGDGGSGGGGGSNGSGTHGGSGGSDGSNGISYDDQILSENGKGQGYTTRAFGEPTGDLYAGGGGGGSETSPAKPGGAGGGGDGGYNAAGSAGEANTGGGGGGAGNATSAGGKGGSGIIIIRMAKTPYQEHDPLLACPRYF